MINDDDNDAIVPIYVHGYSSTTAEAHFSRTYLCSILGCLRWSNYVLDNIIYLSASCE